MHESEGEHNVAREAIRKDFHGRGFVGLRGQREYYEQEGEEGDADDKGLLRVVSFCPGRDCFSVGEVGGEAGEERESEGEEGDEEEGVWVRLVGRVEVIVVVSLAAPEDDVNGEEGGGED
jgi:hypothetical protein